MKFFKSYAGNVKQGRSHLMGTHNKLLNSFYMVFKVFIGVTSSYTLIEKEGTKAVSLALHYIGALMAYSGDLISEQ